MPSKQRCYTDSNVGSRTEVDICAHILCEGRFAGAVAAHWPNSRVFPFAGGRPREVPSPKGKLGENVAAFSPGAIKTRAGDLPASLTFPENKTQKETVSNRRIEKRRPTDASGLAGTKDRKWSTSAK
jgi:hypothetical protein